MNDLTVYITPKWYIRKGLLDRRIFSYILHHGAIEVLAYHPSSSRYIVCSPYLITDIPTNVVNTFKLYVLNKLIKG